MKTEPSGSVFILRVRSVADARNSHTLECAHICALTRYLWETSEVTRAANAVGPVKEMSADLQERFEVSLTSGSSGSEGLRVHQPSASICTTSIT